MKHHKVSRRPPASPQPEHLAPKRSLSQNFLQDEAALQRMAGIIAQAQNSSGSQTPVVEIGPGTGALTRHLLAHFPVHAAEKDPRAVALLRETFGTPAPGHHTCRITEGDIRAWDLPLLLPAEGPTKAVVVGNLPYALSADILLWSCTWHSHIASCHYLLQREVVERLAAPTGTKDYGRLTIFVSLHFEVVRHFDIPPEAFFPRPKVTSTFFSLVPKPQAPATDELRQWIGLVSAGLFSQRRKMMRKSLVQLFTSHEIPYDDHAKDLHGILERCGTNLNDRPERLSPQAVLELAQLLAKARALRADPTP